MKKANAPLERLLWNCSQHGADHEAKDDGRDGGDGDEMEKWMQFRDGWRRYSGGDGDLYAFSRGTSTGHN